MPLVDHAASGVDNVEEAFDIACGRPRDGDDAVGTACRKGASGPHPGAGTEVGLADMAVIRS